MPLGLCFQLLWFSHNPMHKIVEKCRSGQGTGVGIPYNSTFRYPGPWHTRIAITFVLIYIFTRGFLQRFKHRLDIILSFVLSQGNFLVLSQDATFSFVTGVVGVGALARARISAKTPSGRAIRPQKIVTGCSANVFVYLSICNQGNQCDRISRFPIYRKNENFKLNLISQLNNQLIG